MPKILRQHSPNKHRRVVRLTPEERKKALANDFTASELDAPMHDSRVYQLMVTLGLVQPPRLPAVPVSHSADELALPHKAPVPERPALEEAEQLSHVEVVTAEGDWYRPWPGELSDEELEDLSQQAVSPFSVN